MIEAYNKYLINYCNFNGCTRRKDYWYVVLANILISIIISTLVLITKVEQLYFLAYIFEISMIIPSIAITVRRLHDINRPGWHYFLSFIPIAGPIIIIILMCEDRVEPNNYGERI